LAYPLWETKTKDQKKEFGCGPGRAEPCGESFFDRNAVSYEEAFKRQENEFPPPRHQAHQELHYQVLWLFLVSLCLGGVPFFLNANPYQSIIVAIFST
jgi:hypothetical protein